MKLRANLDKITRNFIRNEFQIKLSVNELGRVLKNVLVILHF